MIEIVIERWTNAEGKTGFRWSVWDEGHRIQMGENVHSRADDCEAQAVEFCWRKLGRKPDSAIPEPHDSHFMARCNKSYLTPVLADSLLDWPCDGNQPRETPVL